MKAQRVVTLLFAAVTLGASGTYLFVYLYRWEWNRALISGVIFLAAEVGVVGWSLHLKLSGIDRRIDERTDRRSRIDSHLGDARSEPSHPFAWLRPDGSQMGVFIPILLGAGLVMSGLAWVLDHLGRATAGRIDDRRIAERLSRLGPPRGGFLYNPGDPARQLRGPRPNHSDRQRARSVT